MNTYYAYKILTEGGYHAAAFKTKEECITDEAAVYLALTKVITENHRATVKATSLDVALEKVRRSLWADAF